MTTTDHFILGITNKKKKKNDEHRNKREKDEIQ